MNLITAWFFTILGACLVSGNPMYRDRSRFTFSNLTNIYSQFSNELVQTIDHDLRDNFVVSPLSLAESLFIAFTGAGGETEEELKTVLHLSDPVVEVMFGNLRFIEELNALNGQVKLLNSLYVSNKFNLRPDMKELITRGFLATIENVNFTNVARVARYINKYVKINTNGTINNVVKPDTLSSDTIMVAVNVLYFKSEWEGFADLEELRDFHVGNEEVVKTPMIRASNVYKYFESETLKIVSIPFKNEDFTMTLVMSTRDDPHVLPSLSESLYLIHENEDYVQVILPKFIIESQHDLVPIMKTMGVNHMFSKRWANFSKFSDKDDRVMYVSSLIQKAYIKVNSGGVEASAATVTYFGDRFMDDSSSHFLCFDRPFFAYITYKSMPLFAIRVNDPRDSSTS